MDGHCTQHRSCRLPGQAGSSSERVSNLHLLVNLHNSDRAVHTDKHSSMIKAGSVNMAIIHIFTTVLEESLYIHIIM